MPVPHGRTPGEDVHAVLNEIYDMQRAAGDLLRSYERSKDTLVESCAYLSYGNLIPLDVEKHMRKQKDQVRETIARLQKYLELLDRDYPEE